MHQLLHQAAEALGGGGYYGGSGSSGLSNGSWNGGGGSSFISGYAGVNAITSAASTVATNNTKHYSGKYFIYTQMLAGNAVMPNPSGGTMTGNTGNGYAKITYEGKTAPARTNTKLNNVRYIKSCVTRYSTNSGNTVYWNEIQAIKDGVNVAKGKDIIDATHALLAASPSYNNILNGIIDIRANVVETVGTVGEKCITVDLKNIYDLDEVALWNLSINGYSGIMENNMLFVSSDKSTWTTLHNYPGTTGYNETPQGKHYTAWD